MRVGGFAVTRAGKTVRIWRFASAGRKEWVGRFAVTGDGVAGAWEVDDDVGGFGSGGGLGVGGSVAGMAMDYGLAVEEELGDVGHGGGVAAFDFAGGELCQQIAEKQIDVVRGREIVRAGEKCGG
jgi:hypothetical protein